MRREWTRVWRAVVVLVVVTMCAPRLAHGVWSYDPALNTPVCTAIADQIYPIVAPDGRGGVVVAWVDYRLSGYGDIYAQRFSAQGDPLWAADGVPVCRAQYAQSQVCIAPDGAGGAFIAWTDDRGAFRNIYAQRLDSLGTAQWTAEGEALGFATRTQIDPAIAGDGAGHAIVTYTDQKTTSNDEICSAGFDGNTILWRADRVSWASGPQNGSRVIPDASGGVFVTWDDRRSGSYTDYYDIYAQRVLFDGTVMWAQDGVPVCDARYQQSGTRACLDGSGGVIVAWIDKQVGTGYFDVFANRLDVNGVRQWGAGGRPVVSVPGSHEYYQHLVPDGAGGAILVWQDDRNTANVVDLYAQRIDGAGQPLWQANGVPVCVAPNDQLLSITQAVNMTSDGAGGAVIVWEDKRGGASDLFAQRLDASGHTLWPANGIPVCTAPQSQRAPSVMSDGAAGAVVAWYDERSGRDIYAARLRASGAPFTIAASAGPHGQVVPSGVTYVPSGDTQTFTFVPDVDYMVQDVLVDGASVGAVTSYTFSGVAASHTLAVSFTLAPRNIIAFAAASACLTPGTPTLRVPATVTRIANATPLRGFSVVVQVSSHLQLAAGTASIREGAYLASLGPTMFQVTDRGGGAYAVDGVLLGQPCGATAAAGTLFDVEVTHAGIPGTGALAVTTTTLRDCGNLDVVSSAGPPSPVTIDLTPVQVGAIATQSAIEDVEMSLVPIATLDACATGPVTWSGSNLPETATVDPATGRFTWTPSCRAFDQGPQYGPVTLAARDAVGNVGVTTFGIVVANGPGTVAVAAIGGQSVAETATLVVQPQATPQGCAEPPFTWTGSGLPSGATVDPASGEFRWTPDCHAAQNGGVYGPIVLQARAATGGTGSTAFHVVVTNTPGTVFVEAVETQMAVETVPLHVVPFARVLGCADGPVTWTGSGVPSDATVDPATGEFVWTPDCRAADLDPHRGPFTLTAHAASGETGSVSFSVAITNLPGAVSIAPIAAQSIAEGATLTVTPLATLSGCAETPVSWTVTGLPGAAAVDPTTGTFTWTPGCRAAQDGPVYGPVTLTATALTGEAASHGFVITVTDVPTIVAPVSDLVATPHRLGAETDGTVPLSVTFQAPSGADIEVYRAPFGNYPEYDDAPDAGAVPSIPSYPPPAPWTRTAIAASGQLDDPPSRDCWFYVAFARNACTDLSPASALSGGTPNYHLGDVTDGAMPGQGDNRVGTLDVSLLGAHYGTLLAPHDALGYLDVGPTVDRSAVTRPLTDSRVEFEDAMVFALNFDLVAAPSSGPQIASAGADALTARVPALPASGEEFAVPLWLAAAGDLHGVSARLAYDGTVVDFVRAESGALLAQQDLPSLVLSSAPGVIDAALFGSGAALRGEGPLALAIFRVVSAGDPQIALVAADGRDGENRPVTIALATDVAAPPPRVPDVTALGPLAPNPVTGAATLSLALHESGPVRLRLFDVGGRCVRTLLDEQADAGTRTVRWDGRGEDGRRVGAGLYVMRLDAGGTVCTRTVHVVR